MGTDVTWRISHLNLPALPKPGLRLLITERKSERGPEVIADDFGLREGEGLTPRSEM